MNADTRQNKLQDDDKHNDPEFVHKAVVVAKLLTYCLIGPLISIYGMLFGPQWTWVFGIAAFIAPVIVMVKSREATGARFRLVCPEGLAGQMPRLRSYERLIRGLALIAVFVATVSIVTMFVAERGDGSANDSKPVFAERERYRLNQHNKMTEVSRDRYRIAAASGVIGLNFGAIFAVSLALHALLYGCLPQNLGEKRKSSPNEDTK